VAAVKKREAVDKIAHFKLREPNFFSYIKGAAVSIVRNENISILKEGKY
jgi:hypothetical protein